MMPRRRNSSTSRLRRSSGSLPAASEPARAGGSAVLLLGLVFGR
ncbi:hypothetical protein ACFMQL_40435 [Nonomuraea fastidiosa]